MKVIKTLDSNYQIPVVVDEDDEIEAMPREDSEGDQMVANFIFQGTVKMTKLHRGNGAVIYWSLRELDDNTKLYISPAAIARWFKGIQEGDFTLSRGGFEGYYTWKKHGPRCTLWPLIRDEKLDLIGTEE